MHNVLGSVLILLIEFFCCNHFNQSVLKKNVVYIELCLRWEFQTDDYDIGFSIIRKGSNKKEDEVILPMHRVRSQHITEDGSVTCDKPGACEALNI